MVIGVKPVSTQSASFYTVWYALAILIFISCCTLCSLRLLLPMSKAFVHTGAPYRRSGSIPPVYIVLRAACWIPQLSLSDFDLENISFVHFSAV